MYITGALNITRCSDGNFDTLLCGLDEIANITRVYLGRNNDTSRCHHTPGDCTRELDSDELPFRDLINKCNGTSACQDKPSDTSLPVSGCDACLDTSNTTNVSLSECATCNDTQHATNMSLSECGAAAAGGDTNSTYQVVEYDCISTDNSEYAMSFTDNR